MTYRTRIKYSSEQKKEIWDRWQRTIASKLGRSPSTISREIKRNQGTKHYRATSADQAAGIR